MAGEDAVLKLDVVTELAFGPLRRAAHGSRRPGARRPARGSGDLWLPAPADAFWSLLLHALMDKGRVRDERARELVALAPAARDERSALRDVVDALVSGGMGIRTRARRRRASRLGRAARAGAPPARPLAQDDARRAAQGKVAARRLLRKAWRLQQRGSMTSNKRPRSTG